MDVRIELPEEVVNDWRRAYYAAHNMTIGRNHAPEEYEAFNEFFNEVFNMYKDEIKVMSNKTNWPDDEFKLLALISELLSNTQLGTMIQAGAEDSLIRINKEIRQGIIYQEIMISDDCQG